MYSCCLEVASACGVKAPRLCTKSRFRCTIFSVKWPIACMVGYIWATMHVWVFAHHFHMSKNRVWWFRLMELVYMYAQDRIEHTRVGAHWNWKKTVWQGGVSWHAHSTRTTCIWCKLDHLEASFYSCCRHMCIQTYGDLHVSPSYFMFNKVTKSCSTVGGLLC